MNKVAIAFICDDNYVVPTVVAITSLIENKRKVTYYDIFIIASELTEEHIQLFDRFNGDRVKVTVILASARKYDSLHKDSSSIYLVASTAALLKFDLPQIVKNYDKVIYLDGDIIVLSDLEELFEQDVSKVYAGVVRDVPQVLIDKPLIETASGRDYFNSGVMLLNLAKIREDNITELLIQTKRESTDTSLMDQNVFNDVFRGHVKQLPLKYNVLYINLARSQNHYTLERLNKTFNTSYTSLDDIRKDAQIIHFSSEDKPWKFFDIPMADYWIRYFEMSPLGRNKIVRESIKNKSKDERFNKKIILSEIDNHIIPIVFACNESYAPYLATAISSIKEHASNRFLYSIYVLYDNISSDFHERLCSMACENIHIQLVDVSNMVLKSDLYSRAHYSEEMYYRWLIPEIFSQYDKVLYLDCDLVVQKDIAELYKYDIGNKVIGGINNFSNFRTRDRVERDLKVPIDQYINSGVLLINVNRFIKDNIKEKCFKLVDMKNELICPDQDIINMVCRNNICYIDDVWNFQWHHQWNGEGYGLLDHFQERYDRIKECPNIIHFTAGIKPWKNIDREMAHYFWKYARNTPFYEQLLLSLMKGGEVTLRSSADQEIRNIHASVSYKIGRFITFIPRKIRGGIRCYKEHGMRYTWRRLKEHLHIS